MEEDFLDLFSNLAVNRFNKYRFHNGDDLIRLDVLGLHRLSNRKQKEQHFHSHSFSELHFSMEGYCIYQLGNNTEIKLEKGSWLLMPQYCPHKILKYSDNYIKFSCSFELLPPSPSIPPFIYEEVCKVLKHNEHSMGEMSEFAISSIKYVYEALFSSNYLSEAMLKGLTMNVVLDTLSSLCVPKYLHRSSTPKDDARLAIAMQFIQDNISRKISCDDVARRVYVSTRQLDRIFLKNTSISVAEFIYEKKCEEAKKLLVATQLPIKTISENLGFSAPSYFNRFFKKRAGVPPYKFRETALSQEKNFTEKVDK